MSKLNHLMPALFASAIIVASIAASRPASAQTEAAQQASSGGDFDEIIVTARKRDEKIQTVPIAITAFNQADLDAKGVKTVADLRFLAPSVYIQTDVFQQDTVNITIRGQRNFAGNGVGDGVQFDTATAIYLNGIYLARTQGLAGSLFDLDTVEVLKGPQGTLVGRNATGGAVLYKTKEPQDDFGGYIKETLGDYGVNETQGALNVPVTEKFAVRAAMSYSESDGYLKNIYVDPATGYRNPTAAFGYRKLSGQFSAKFTPDDTFKLVLHGDFDTEHDSGTGYHDLGYFVGTVASVSRPSICNIPGSCTTSGSAAGVGFTDLLGHYIAPYFTTPATQTSPGVVSINPAAYNSLLASLQRQQNDFWTTDQAVPSTNIDHVHDVSATADKHFEAFDAKLTAGYRWFDTFGQSASRGDPYDAVQTTYVVPDYQAYTSELTFNGDLFDDKFKWTTGGFFFAESASGGSAQYLYSPNYAKPQAVSGRQVTLSDLSHNSGDNKSYAAYAQGTYNILDSLRLTAGARYTIDQREANIVSQTVRFPATAATNATVTNSVFSPGTYYLNGIGYTGYSTSCAIQDAKGVSLPLNACMLDVHKTFNRPTWMVSLDYDLFEHSLLYVTTRSGYRSGAINAGLNGSNANLLVALPETVQDYELGIKSDWEIAGMPIRTNIDGYYTDYHDIQTQVSLPFVALAVGPGGGPCTQAAFNAALCTGTSTQGVMVNAKRADIYGAEWDIEMKPIPQLTLTTGGSYLHAFYRDFSYAIPAGYLAPATGVANLNNTPFPLPQWQINGSATYTLTGEEAKLPVDSISISGDWYYESAIKASFVGYVYPLEQVKGYQFFGARFNAENIMNSKISFSAYVTNLFDEKACAPESNGTVNSVPNATIGTPNTSGVTQCEPLAPRMFGVTMKYVF